MFSTVSQASFSDPAYAAAAPMQSAAVGSIAQAAAHRHHKKAPLVKPAITAGKVASIRDRYDGSGK